MKHPNFFIVGAPKCGTTALAQYLSEHESVFMADPKEPHHFSTDLNHGRYRDADEYLDLFSAAERGHVAVGEASVWYLYSREAVPNILARYPDARFIVMFRNPVDMAYSLYDHLYFEGSETVASFRAAWDLQEARRNGRHVPASCTEPARLQYRSVCSLGQQYERLLARVGAERVFPIVMDDLVERPRSVWLDLLHFLGVADDGRTEFPPANVAKERKSVVLNRMNDLYRRFRQSLGLRGFGTGLLSSLDRWNRRVRPRTSLSGEMRELLASEFRDDVALLSCLLERDLGGWP